MGNINKLYMKSSGIDEILTNDLLIKIIKFLDFKQYEKINLLSKYFNNLMKIYTSIYNKYTFHIICNKQLWNKKNIQFILNHQQRLLSIESAGNKLNNKNNRKKRKNVNTGINININPSLMKKTFKKHPMDIVKHINDKNISEQIHKSFFNWFTLKKLLIDYYRIPKEKKKATNNNTTNNTQQQQQNPLGGLGALGNIFNPNVINNLGLNNAAFGGAFGGVTGGAWTVYEDNKYKTKQQELMDIILKKMYKNILSLTFRNIRNIELFTKTLNLQKFPKLFHLRLDLNIDKRVLLFYNFDNLLSLELYDVLQQREQETANRRIRIQQRQLQQQINNRNNAANNANNPNVFPNAFGANLPNNNVTFHINNGVIPGGFGVPRNVLGARNAAGPGHGGNVAFIHTTNNNNTIRNNLNNNNDLNNDDEYAKEDEKNEKDNDIGYILNMIFKQCKQLRAFYCALLPKPQQNDMFGALPNYDPDTFNIKRTVIFPSTLQFLFLSQIDTWFNIDISMCNNLASFCLIGDNMSINQNFNTNNISDIDKFIKWPTKELNCFILSQIKPVGLGLNRNNNSRLLPHFINHFYQYLSKCKKNKYLHINKPNIRFIKYLISPSLVDISNTNNNNINNNLNNPNLNALNNIFGGMFGQNVNLNNIPGLGLPQNNNRNNNNSTYNPISKNNEETVTIKDLNEWTKALNIKDLLSLQNKNLVIKNKPMTLAQVTINNQVKDDHDEKEEKDDDNGLNEDKLWEIVLKLNPNISNNQIDIYKNWFNLDISIWIKTMFRSYQVKFH